jgi:hypothetical protein
MCVCIRIGLHTACSGIREALANIGINNELLRYIAAMNLLECAYQLHKFATEVNESVRLNCRFIIHSCTTFIRKVRLRVAFSSYLASTDEEMGAPSTVPDLPW